MQTANAHFNDCQAIREQRRDYRIKRQYSSQRKLKDLVRDLLRAHCGA